jgi:hypothetical protein
MRDAGVCLVSCPNFRIGVSEGTLAWTFSRKEKDSHGVHGVHGGFDRYRACWPSNRIHGAKHVRSGTLYLRRKGKAGTLYLRRKGKAGTLYLLRRGKAGTLYLLRRGKAGRLLTAGRRKTKSRMRRNAIKVAGGTAKSLAIKRLVVIFERQTCTMETVVTQLATTTAEYCMICRI